MSESNPRDKSAVRSVIAVLAKRLGKGPNVLLRDPERASASTSGTEAETAKLAGRYRIVGEIASGGVGVVYRAHDVDLGRDVAMKVLKPKLLERDDVLERFVEEAQIGGQLQHPGIVPVYEFGLLDAERPYIAMKLVKGTTLNQMLAERSSPAQNRGRFLSIFESICQSVAYAHARGVVHRDLKPANVMVGAFGELQIVDWGFAKVLGRPTEPRASGSDSVSMIATVRTGEDSSGSITGSVMGTPAYMPPEQALGLVEEVDERSDVFSLGAILCEVLTGEPPYPGDSGAVSLTKAAQADLEPAFARLEACDADTELVDLAKRCLNGAQPERPRNAQVLATAIGQYLTSVEDRARAAQLEAVEADARADAEKARAAALKSKAKAERGRAEQERRARRLTLVLAATVVAVLLLGGGVYLHSEKAARERLAEGRREVQGALEKAARLHGEARQADADAAAPTWAAARAAASRAVGLARDTDPATRKRAEEVAAKIAEDTRAAEIAAERARKAADLVAHLEQIRLRRGDVQDARAADADYAAAFAPIGIQPDGEVASMERARSFEPLDPLVEALDDWAWTRRALGGDWQGLVRLAKALDPDPWRRSLRDAIVTADSAALRGLADSADSSALDPTSLRLLAVSLGHAGDVARAVRLLHAAVRRHPEDPWLNQNLGYWLMRVDPPRYGEAARFVTAALAMRPQSAGLRNNLGLALAAADDLEGAVEAYADAIRLRPGFASAHNNLGLVYLEQGHHEEARAEFRKALQADGKHQVARYNLGTALEKTGRPREAITAYREVLRSDAGLRKAHEALVEALLGENEVEAAVQAAREAVASTPASWSYHLLGYALGVSGEIDEAIRQLAEAIRRDESYAPALHDMAAAYGARRDWRTALKYAEQAVKADPTVAKHWDTLGFIRLTLSENEKALQAALRARTLAPRDPVVLDHLGAAYSAVGNSNGAEESWRSALELDPGPMTRMNLYGQLGDLLQRQRRPEEAAKWYRQCLESTDGEILPSAAWGYGTTLVTLGRAQDALAVAEEFRKRFVDSRSASLLVGRASPEQVEFIVGFFRRLANVEDRYEALAAGRKEPADEAELISLALMCYLRENYVASARFFGQVSPEVSGSGQMSALTRFYAGCAALAAGCGNGVEGGRLDVAERAEFRRVGRERLSTELKRMQALIEEDFAGYYLMAFGYAETLLRDQLFEFVRSPSSLRWLPEAERDEWNAFWSQVKALQEKAR